jgi:hypothetical protein
MGILKRSFDNFYKNGFHFEQITLINIKQEITALFIASSIVSPVPIITISGSKSTFNKTTHEP